MSHAPDIPETYVLLVQVLSEDRSLLTWFCDLEGLPANRRMSELGRVAAGFRTDGEEELARTLLSLNDEAIRASVLRVVEAEFHGTLQEQRCRKER